MRLTPYLLIIAALCVIVAGCLQGCVTTRGVEGTLETRADLDAIKTAILMAPLATETILAIYKDIQAAREDGDAEAEQDGWKRIQSVVSEYILERLKQQGIGGAVPGVESPAKSSTDLQNWMARYV